MQTSEGVIIKGVRDGLLLILDSDIPFSQIMSELAERVRAQPNFFNGAPVTVNAGHRIIDNPEFDMLYRMLTRNGMRVQSFVSLSAQSRLVAESFGVTSRPPSFAAGDAGRSLGLRERGSSVAHLHAAQEGGVPEVGTGLFLRCSLRSGQMVRYAGDVCVMGDVDNGAEVLAEGDVIVWGVLRGLVHAGMAGDDEAVVCALQMEPVQLGIAGIVSRFPSTTARLIDPTRRPELARLEGGRIVIESWQGEQGE